MILEEWDPYIKKFITYITDYGDKKQIVNALKIIEELLKNYQDLDQGAQGRDEDDDEADWPT